MGLLQNLRFAAVPCARISMKPLENNDYRTYRNTYLVGYSIFWELVLDVLLYLLFISTYHVYEVPSGSEMSVTILVR